ncbi:MAG: rhodanese-like domain-containing protein [Pyrinomonadaceae bacterium]
MSFKTISPGELKEKLQNGENLKLIDVREPEEFVLAQINGATLLPLSEFQSWSDKLNPADEIVVICHHGIRSAQVCSYLASSGFGKIWNLSGGIDRWSVEVDKSVPRY